jgi:hypothetical protein
MLQWNGQPSGGDIVGRPIFDALHTVNNENCRSRIPTAW